MVMKNYRLVQKLIQVLCISKGNDVTVAIYKYGKIQLTVPTHIRKVASE